MADAVQAQETGGGEGSAPVQPPQEEKPVEKPSVPQDAKPAEPAAAQQNDTAKDPEASPAKPLEEQKAEEAKPNAVASATAPVVPQPEAPATSDTPATSANPPAAVTDPVVPPAAPVATTDQNANNVGQPTTSTDPLLRIQNWQQRELELLKKIEELEKVRNERSEDGLKLELKVREEEIDLLKARVRNLETELHAALSKPSGKNHEMIENIKQQHEELLSKARGMIFDKTKMVKNQELQIEALTTQVQSLKDINLITKDLLEIRNSEVKAMEDRLQAMEARFKAEKERYGLVLQRAQTSSNINDDLKKEYETQLAIFKELRVKYEQRVQALVDENEKLKASVSAATGTPAAAPQ